jgi:ribosome maturation protein SDO1
MADTKLTIVRLSLDGNKFEILVKPDPALEYKLGKRTDLSSILVSDEIYSDANKGSRAANEKLIKYFKTTDQRRKMVEEKKKQIIQYINKSFVDPKTHVPHPPLRIESAMDEARVIIDPSKRAEDQAKTIIDSLRKILPLKSETLRLTVTVPPQFSAQSYSVLKTVGNFNGEQWLTDGSLRVVVEINAGIKGTFLDRIGSITKGSAQVIEQ